jgi:tetratricopeptide (TPR) repeat protein
MVIISVFRILTLSLLLYTDGSALEFFSIGNQLELEGKINEAIEYYQKAQELEPNAIEIYVSLTSALYMLQRFDEGIGYMEQALAIEPDNVRLYQILALGHVGKRDFAQAIEYYEKASAIDPGNQELYIAIATLLEASKEIKKAIGVLERMPVELKTAEIYIKLAALSGRVNDHQSAIDYYRLGYALDTTNVTATIGIGTGFDLIGIKDSAIYYYEKAIKDTLILSVAQRLVDLYTDIDMYDAVVEAAEGVLSMDPENTHVRRSIGFAYYKLGMLDLAADEFYIALRHDSRDTYSAFYLARIYYEQEKFDQALIEVNNAIESNPDFVELWIYLGFIAIEKRDYELAEHSFAEAAYRGGDLTQIYYLLGAVAETQADDGEAYRYYKKSLAEDPGNVSVLQALAGLLSDLGREEETFQIFQKIIEMDSLNAVALNYVGYTYAERNDSLEYALQLVNRALDIDKDNGYYIDSRGWIFYMMARYEDALHELKRASEIVEDAVIYEHLGDVYRQLNDGIKAREAYEKALELDPSNNALMEKLSTQD